MKVDSGLCQLTAAGTPIPTQIGCRLGVTFVVDVETDILRPIHISVERIPVAVAVAVFTHTRTDHAQHADSRLFSHRHNTSCSCRALTLRQLRFP
ncbi:MAG: hypothetical protein J07HQW1_02719 [Haloquadratum walsbyi J07HQW1]|uniref:Uncharacterized protein n=1 Tax=Haloquadratum walsbyi J07HQW1 TaxID=1238424 RepID=U1MRE5_9EURY|nr:MAG: hypothetical protein J07HQW1_02719 [Haloquadratum walsbyi J07HQW1]